MAGATAAVGSGVVKVPIAVCIRSVQAGVYPNVVQAARTITAKAGPMGLFTGFLPTLLEDVPDMAVKFAVYETMRITHSRLTNGRQPSTLEDLVMGGSAGAAAAAATTPLDVVKTRMMCSASSRPTLLGAARSVMAEGEGFKAFFRGVGPRALSNGINSAVFFCFFEAIRRVSLQINARQLGCKMTTATVKAGLWWQCLQNQRNSLLQRNSHNIAALWLCVKYCGQQPRLVSQTADVIRLSGVRWCLLSWTHMQCGFQ